VLLPSDLKALSEGQKVTTHGWVATAVGDHHVWVEDPDRMVGLRSTALMVTRSNAAMRSRR